MVQNHLLQVVSLFAMEPPIAFDPDAVRDEKLKVLKALRYIPEGDFAGRWCARNTLRIDRRPDGAGYRDEPNVARSRRPRRSWR